MSAVSLYAKVCALSGPEAQSCLDAATSLSPSSPNAREAINQHCFKNSTDGNEHSPNTPKKGQTTNRDLEIWFDPCVLLCGYTDIYVRPLLYMCPAEAMLYSLLRGAVTNRLRLYSTSLEQDQVWPSLPFPSLPQIGRAHV